MDKIHMVRAVQWATSSILNHRPVVCVDQSAKYSPIGSSLQKFHSKKVQVSYLVSR